MVHHPRHGPSGTVAGRAARVRLARYQECGPLSGMLVQVERVGQGLDELERDLTVLRVLAVADAELHAAGNRRTVDHDRAGPAGSPPAWATVHRLRAAFGVAAPPPGRRLATAGRPCGRNFPGRDEGRDAVFGQGLADRVGVGHLPRVQGQGSGAVGAGDDRERRQMDRRRLRAGAAGPAGPGPPARPTASAPQAGLEELGELRLFSTHNPLTHQPRRSAYLAGRQATQPGDRQLRSIRGQHVFKPPGPRLRRLVGAVVLAYPLF